MSAGSTGASGPPMGVAFVRAPGLARRLRRLLAETARDLDADEATLWVFDADEAWLAAALNFGPTSAIVEAQRVPADASVIGMVATQGLTVAIGPGDAQNPTVIEATGTPVRAMVAAPVRLAGENVGALSVVNPHGSERFAAGALDAIAWKATLVEALLTLAGSPGAAAE